MYATPCLPDGLKEVVEFFLAAFENRYAVV